MPPIRQDVSLREFSTMRLGGTARYQTTITDKPEVVQVVAWSRQHQVPIIVVGEGNNIIWRDEGFDGLLVSNRIRGYSEARQDDGSVLVTVGAGERWDSVVARSADSDLAGIVAMSSIPGTAGAALFKTSTQMAKRSQTPWLQSRHTI